jgi:hypothetical protein
MKRLTFVLLVMMAGGLAQAQSKRDSVHTKRNEQPGLITSIGKGEKWLADNGFELRKTLDGSKNEQSPASIGLDNDYQHNAHYFVIDLGIKLLELPLLKKTSPAFLNIYPKFEWHKNGIPDATKTTNTVTGGLNAEFMWPLGNKHWWQRPYVTGSFDYKNDLVKKLETTQTKGYLTFSGDKNLNPGSVTRTNVGVFILRYYPYSGFEYYQSIAKTGQSGALWANRFYMEIYPVSSLLYQYVQLTFDYTHRIVLKDNLYNQGNLDWLSVGFNIYPDGKGNVGVGLSYNKGEDPNSNFVKTDILVLGLKLKI